MRLFGSAFLLMAFASIRFADAIEVEVTWRSKTAVCGRSVDQENPSGPLIQWAAVRKGMRSDGAWLNPISGYWGKFKPPGAGEYQWLMPYVSPTWAVDYSRPCSGNVFQHATRRVEAHLGFTPSLHATARVPGLPRVQDSFYFLRKNATCSDTGRRAAICPIIMIGRTAPRSSGSAIRCLRGLLMVGPLPARLKYRKQPMSPKPH